VGADAVRIRTMRGLVYELLAASPAGTRTSERSFALSRLREIMAQVSPRQEGWPDQGHETARTGEDDRGLEKAPERAHAAARGGTGFIGGLMGAAKNLLRFTTYYSIKERTPWP
jgi:hypothetical protein